MEEQIKIMIVDDHEMVIQGLSALIGRFPGFEIIATYNNGLEAIEGYPTDKPDIVLMDINMPKINGFETANAILEKDDSAKIIMLSMEVNKAYVRKAHEDGIKGYVSKSADISELIGAIKNVFGGGVSFSQPLMVVKD